MRAILTALTLFVLTGVGLAQGEDNSTTSYFFRVTVPKGSTKEDVICILCSAEIHGKLTGDLVLIGGNAEISGPVDGDVVVVGGWIHTRGPIGGDALAIGGSLEKEPGAKIAGDAESYPWFHLPGQRSFHPLGVLCLLGGQVLSILIAGGVWRRERSDRLADRLVRWWWLALVVGLGLWFVYFEYLDEYEPASTVMEIVFWLLLLLLSVATWFGYYGLAWALGRRVFRTAAWKTMLAGALILSAALLVPLLGMAVLCGSLCIGLGAGLLFTWPAFRVPAAPEAS
ncbi:MAG: hypothetical protein EHM61_27250 [Acidobacteria bacterium]|nr:MAG: hypothetical protein EHM61_27250 [Acidobacteriota bacterium]